MDAEWRFTEGTACSLLERAVAATRSTDTILLMGVPSVAIAAFQSEHDRVFSVLGEANIITDELRELTADDGKSFNVRTDTKGVVTLLYFGYTHCPDLCPLTMSNTSVALRMLPKADQAKIRVLFVSVDPGRGTLPRLRSWLGGFDPAFIGLRGTLPDVEAFERQTGLPLGPVYKDSAGYFQLDHATEMFAYSTNNVAHEAFFPSTPPAEMAHDLKLLVAGGIPS